MKKVGVILGAGILLAIVLEEYEADAHGVDILQRAGCDGKQIMGGTLSRLLKTSGASGGFFETHPGTDDRIQRIHNLR